MAIIPEQPKPLFNVPSFRSENKIVFSSMPIRRQMKNVKRQAKELKEKVKRDSENNQNFLDLINI